MHKSWLSDDLLPPFGFTSFFGAVVLCIITFYVFKKLSGDSNIPLRGVRKGHNWNPVKVTAKVIV